MKTVKFEQIYSKRDKMPVVHYPIASQVPANMELCGEHLNDSRINKVPGHLIYIHIPFCQSLCSFCPYSKVLNDAKKIEAYINALKKEILLYAGKPYIKNLKFVGVYIGGGTPSVLPAKYLLDIIHLLYSSFNLDSNVQITVEGSPSSFTYEKLHALKKNGVNRISLGIQTFDRILGQMLGLPQKFEVAESAIKNAHYAGFEDVSIDLMYNLPGQTHDIFVQDLQKMVELNINQCTLYALSVVPTTNLFKLIENGNLPSTMPDYGEYQYEMVASTFLQDAGFSHITNTDWYKSGAKNIYADISIMPDSHYGFSDLLALGASSFGELNNRVYLNLAHVDKYIEMLAEDKFPIEKYTIDGEGEKPNKYVSMGFRKLRLLNNKFCSLFGMNIVDVWPNLLAQLEQDNLIEINDDAIELTSLGCFYVYNISKMFFSSQYHDNPQIGYCGKKI